MADKRIKGITIEIDGKTTGLTKALKAANSEIKTAQSHLRDVEQALKLDPKNVELVNAKQHALNEVIAETKKKLDMEKEAAINAKKALEMGEITQSEYDALQAEIVKTTKKLKELEKQAKQLPSAIKRSIQDISKKIKTVNDEIKKTQEHLKNVDKALKLDPKNIEMLKAKQRALNNVIAETKEKLELEKKAAKEAKVALTLGEITQSEYDALQAAVVTTTKELKNLEKQSRQSASVIGSVMQTIGKDIKKVGDNIEAAGKKVQDVGDKVEKVGKTMTTKITAPILAGGTAAVKTAADFDSAMSRVEAISGATGEDLEKLRAKAREMGSTTKFSATEAAEAMYYMAMAGWKAEDMLNGIEGIMNLAAASEEDLGTTSDIVTDSLTALGMTAEDTNRFIDVMATTASNSNTNVSMLGESYKYVASTAGTLGYSIEDLNVALGLMANSGVKGSQAGTSLKTALARMAAPTDQVADAMDELGISLVDAEGNTKSLMDVMINLRSSIGSVNVDLVDADGNLREYDDIIADLSQTTEGLSQVQQIEAASTIFGKNAMAGMLTIVNATEEDFKALTESVYNSNGAAENMAAIMQDNLGGQLTILKSQLEELAISFGDILMPCIRKIVEKIQGLVDKLNGLDTETKERIIKIAAIAATIGPLILIVSKIIKVVGGAIIIVAKATESIGKITSAIGTAVTFVKGTMIPAITTAISAITPILPIIAAIVLGIMAVITVIKNWSSIMELGQIIAETVIEKIKEIITGFKEFWTTAFQGMADFFTSIWENISETAVNAWEGIKETFSNVGAWFTDKFQQAWDGITGMFSKMGEFFKGVWDDITGIFTTIGTTIADAITGSVKSAVNTVLSGAINIINGFIGAINSVIGVINAIPGVSLSKLKQLNVPQLELGGVLKKGQVGLLEGNGAEAVVPLDKNKAWIAAVAKDFRDALDEQKPTPQPPPAPYQENNPSGDIIIPVYIGQDKLDKAVVKANQINNYRSGGR